MKRSRFTEEQVIAILREQEAGDATTEVCRKHGVSTATFYAWKVRVRPIHPRDPPFQSGDSSSARPASSAGEACMVQANPLNACRSVRAFRHRRRQHLVSDLSVVETAVLRERHGPEQQAIGVARDEGLDETPAQMALGQVLRQGLKLCELGLNVQAGISVCHVIALACPVRCRRVGLREDQIRPALAEQSCPVRPPDVVIRSSLQPSWRKY